MPICPWPSSQMPGIPNGLTKSIGVPFFSSPYVQGVSRPWTVPHPDFLFDFQFSFWPTSTSTGETHLPCTWPTGAPFGRLVGRRWRHGSPRSSGSCRPPTVSQVHRQIGGCGSLLFRGKGKRHAGTNGNPLRLRQLLRCFHHLLADLKALCPPPTPQPVSSFRTSRAATRTSATPRVCLRLSWCLAFSDGSA